MVSGFSSLSKGLGLARVANYANGAAPERRRGLRLRGWAVCLLRGGFGICIWNLHPRVVSRGMLIVVVRSFVGCPVRRNSRSCSLRSSVLCLCTALRGFFLFYLLFCGSVLFCRGVVLPDGVTSTQCSCPSVFPGFWKVSFSARVSLWRIDGVIPTGPGQGAPSFLRERSTAGP
jgi:hypothetical protein